MISNLLSYTVHFTHLISNHYQYVTQSANERLKTIEALKLKHREGMTCKQKEHAEAMAIKNQKLKEADKLAKGMEEIYTELLQGLKQSAKTANVSDKKACALEEKIKRTL